MCFLSNCISTVATFKYNSVALYLSLGLFLPVRQGFETNPFRCNTTYILTYSKKEQCQNRIIYSKDNKWRCLKLKHRHLLGKENQKNLRGNYIYQILKTELKSHSSFQSIKMYIWQLCHMTSSWYLKFLIPQFLY